MANRYSPLDQMLRRISRRKAGQHARKPSFAELEKEGLSREAIRALLVARDFVDHDPETTVLSLTNSLVIAPLDEDDLWPDGPPRHWESFDEYAHWLRQQGLEVPTDPRKRSSVQIGEFELTVVPFEVDPTDREQGGLAASWSSSLAQVRAHPYLGDRWG